MHFVEEPKYTIWQRIWWFFFGKPEINIPKLTKFTMPLIKADALSHNRNMFTKDCLRNAIIEGSLRNTRKEED